MATRSRSAAPAPLRLSLADARASWIAAQRLDGAAPFGAGPDAVRRAVEHLGYVQIDTIHVVERAHHHILWTRIADYARSDLSAAQSDNKTVFEYWTHALAYVPVRDYRFFVPAMRRMRAAPPTWFGQVTPAELQGVIARIRRDGPLSIRDIDDDVLVDKIHPWASRKPSKRALQLGFYRGDLTIAARSGMVKTYELTDRHFGWDARPRAATPAQLRDFRLDRALDAQEVVSLGSLGPFDRTGRAAMAELISARVRRGRLCAVEIAGLEGAAFWMTPEAAARAPSPPSDRAHILSPFDPLVIGRRRLAAFFGVDYRFEAYVPAAKRVLGYFALPVLAGDRIVAAIDAKADRPRQALEIRRWTWLGDGGPADKPAVEAALGRFEAFQFAD